MNSREITAKRQQVRRVYAAHGFHSAEYQKEFDELHSLVMAQMKRQYRVGRDLPPNSKTRRLVKEI